MATATITYTFSDGTTIEAADHNTNFADLVSFVNGSVVHVDGSKSMTGALAMGSNKITGLADGTAATDAATVSQALGSGTIVFGSAPGVDLEVTTKSHRFYLPFDVTLTEIEASVSVAPTGASIKVDVHVNGTTVHTTQTNRAEIAISGFVDAATSIQDADHDDGQYIEVLVDQVGSTIPGQDLLVVISFDRR